MVRLLWGLAVLWAQGIEVRAFLEGKEEGVVFLELRTAAGTFTLQSHLQKGCARFHLPVLTGLQEVILSAPGYLPLRHGQPVSLLQKNVWDFTDPAALHPYSGFVEKDGKAYLAAGELGRLPSEAYPVINAYDIERFLEALRQQDLLADFDNSGRVDEKDYQLLLKNQARLLSTRYE
ncbi:MAG: hypothetical protein NZ958_02115 [Bacteroidia bacterium]|nr:hypothetical protein [Bacteroidia bacterium]MDW8089139.1 hypothetical protein [Bacteroidia bacterium]